jgi:hypothetical protein
LMVRSGRRVPILRAGGLRLRRACQNAVASHRGWRRAGNVRGLYMCHRIGAHLRKRPDVRAPVAAIVVDARFAADERQETSTLSVAAWTPHRETIEITVGPVSHQSDSRDEVGRGASTMAQLVLRRHREIPCRSILASHATPLRRTRCRPEMTTMSPPWDELARSGNRARHFRRPPNCSAGWP